LGPQLTESGVVTRRARKKMEMMRRDLKMGPRKVRKR